MSSSKIVFFVTGSIAAFKACQVISQLVQLGHEVQVVATRAALQFVGTATFEGLTQKKVLCDLWQDGQMMEHIHLSRWADFAVVCPASAHFLAEMAHGLAGDLATATLLAWPKEKPIHVFPAMNALMLENSATQENLKILGQRGFKIHETQVGNLACKETGPGRLLESDEILSRLFQNPKGKIVITSGATREPIDGIRFLSNVSTGQTGAELADLMATLGWRVTLVHGESAVLPRHSGHRVSFSNFSDLNEKLRVLLASEDIASIIHCAAVSDYSPTSVNGRPPRADEKAPTQESLQLQLVRNFKILPRLKEYSRNKRIKVVGFKLTLNHQAPEQVARKILEPSVDAVFANDWSMVQNDRRRHPGTLVTSDRDVKIESLSQLASHLNRWLEET